MKKVTKKAHNDLVSSVYVMFREKKDSYLNHFNPSSEDTYLDRLDYVESVEALLLAHFILPRPTTTDIYSLNCLREQIKRVMY